MNDSRTLNDTVEIAQVRHSLARAANEGTPQLAALLDEAIDTSFTAESATKSLGLVWLDEWLAATPEGTQLIAGQLDMFSIYLRHLTDPHIADVLCSARLLDLIHNRERATLAKAVLAKHLPQDGPWVENAMRVGVDREFIAKAIVDQLADEQHPDRFGLVRTILDNAGQPVATTAPADNAALTIWSVLTDGEWIVTMRTCAQVLPGKLLVNGHVPGEPTLVDLLETRLRHRPDCAEILSDILCLAARCTQHRQAVSLEVLKRLTPPHKRLLLRDFDGYSLEFLVYMAAQLAHGRGLFDECIDRLSATSPDLHLEFCVIQPLLASMEDRVLADHIDETLVTILTLRGFLVGYLTICDFADHSSYAVMVEKHGRTLKYLQAEDDPALLTEGDRVIFDAAHASIKSKSLRLVRFHVLSEANDDV